MLTELGRGLDARNIETTATLSQDGTSFDLHTPSIRAAKAMPPVTPLGGLPKVAVVFAQLVVDGAMHGVRTFVVHLTDGARMCPEISTALLPQRPGCRPLDHAVTSFNHVRLSRDSLLGEISNAGDKRMSFFREIHRVNVGGLALSLVNVPALKAGAYLAYTFSQQRTVTEPSTQRAIPVLSFPTQYGPIISAAAHAAVMEAAGRHIIAVFQKPGVPEALKQALVGIFKATVTYATQRHFSELTDRCGWRGLFSYNKISELQLALKGNSIAEGDVMVLCIRRRSHPKQRKDVCWPISGLASELLQGKHPLPPPENPEALLAQHERGLFNDLQKYLSRDSKGRSNHRSDAFAQHVTPRARDLIQAIGHRFAYDSAARSVRQELIDVWESDCILEDAAWYVEHTGLSSQKLQEIRILAIERARPHLQSIVDGFEMGKHHGSTPLVSKTSSDDFLRDLPSFDSGLPRSRL
jgi:acyl-CoA oxidase